MKECKKCGYKGDNFSKMTKSKDGLQDWCKECNKIQNSEMNPNRNSNLSEKYPTPHSKCVYAFKEKETGEYAYIGESEATSLRIYYHMNYGECSMHIFDTDTPKEERHGKYEYEILWYGDNDLMRKTQEKIMIEKHQPKFNKQYKHG